MKLARFQHFADRLPSIVSDHENICEATIFRFFGGSWFSSEDVKISKSEIIKSLDTTRQTGSHWRYKNEKVAYFKLQEIDSVVQLHFVKPPSHKTRDVADKAIKRLFDSVNQDFDVHHDDLTGCHNRKAFEKELTRILAEARNTSSEANAKVGSSNPNFVHLLSLDIDFFKRVNDKYGHSYGDVVLRAFVWRVEDACRNLTNSFSFEFGIFFARMGGEEFQILLSGLLKPEQAMECADQIRRAVENEPLPSPVEFEVMQRDGFGTGENLPPLTERKITTSIGVATAPAKFSIAPSSKVSERLKAQADLALYSAKEGGRNRVRLFSEILSKYGRIIEHHKDTDIVAIDIGAEIGVQQGQEFFVVHPQYSGEQSFYLDDGRSRKRLGFYPRVNIGRISVFNVQNEISFCRVNARTSTDPFPVGCWLESIPLGSIAHLIASDAGGFARNKLFFAEDIKKYVSDLVSEKKAFVVLIGSLRDINTPQKTYGTRHVNEMLANVHGVLAEGLPAKTRIAQLEPGSFAAVLEYSKKAEILKAAQKCSQRSDEMLNGNDRLCIGVFFSEEDDWIDANFRPDMSKAFDFAAIAATAAVTKKSPVEQFTLNAPWEVLNTAKEEGEYDRGLADYSKFRELGIGSAEVHNVAGILAFESDDLELAEICFLRAVDGGQGVATFQANLGITLFIRRQWKRSYEALQIARDLEDESEADFSHWGAMGFSFWKTLSAEAPIVDFQKAKRLLLDALNHIPEKTPWVATDQLKEALAQAQQRIDAAENQTPTNEVGK